VGSSDELAAQSSQTADSVPLFEVEKILDHRDKKEQLEFLIKWAGYSPRQSTWEPYGNLVDCSNSLDAYLQTKKGQHLQ
jgi:hypothetical protein